MALHWKFCLTTTQTLLAILTIYSSATYLISRTSPVGLPIDRRLDDALISHRLPAFTPPPSDPPINAPGTGTR